MKSDQKNHKQEEGFAGTLKNIQLNDLIQMCCLSSVSLGIRVTKNDRQGIIIIKDGQITHAEVDNLKGEDAFYTILGWDSGIFDTIDAGNISQFTIKQNYQFLLMEAAHQADERENKKEDKDKNASVSKKKLRVLVVDDSPMMSKILTSMLNADERIEVVGTAENGEKALHMLEELKPDLVTMDVNMPVMDGSTALKHIMIKSPCPVLIMSNVGDGSYQGIIDFLNLGAVDFMSKPVQNKNILIQQQKIVERVFQAAGSQIGSFRRIKAPKVIKKIKSSELLPFDSLLIISAGAGGHSVLLDLVSHLPADLHHSVLIFQTIPPALLQTVANYFDERSQLSIVPLSNDISLKRGQCFFTTQGRKITIAFEMDNPIVRFQNSDGAENEWDIFDNFLSMTSKKLIGKISVVLLSGSEVKNLDGLKNIRLNKGKIIIQKRSSCMVPAPLQKIFDQNLFDLELDIEEIVKEISSIN